MNWLYITLAALFIFRNKKTETDKPFMPIDGGKNLVSNDFPLNEYGLPISIHVYSADFPLKKNDAGSVIAVLQQMITQRDFEIPITGIFDDVTASAWNGDVVTIDDFFTYATNNPPIVGDVKIYNFKPNTY